MRSPDIEMAVRLYYEKPEITNADIKALFSTGETQTIKIKKAVKEEMENACKMKVLLKSDAHSGESWYDAKA